MLLSEIVLIVDLFILFLSVISVKIPIANWIGNALAFMCLIPMPTITEPFMIEFTVITLIISIVMTIVNVLRRY